MPDKYNIDAFNELQEKWAKELDFSDASLYKPKRDDRIVTIDVQYTDETAMAGIDITAWPNNPQQILTHKLSVAGQYVPGYFSFYEGPLVVETVDWLKQQNILPDLLVVDGHGLAHPRKFGLACYVGVQTKLPVIGVAKNNLLHYNAKGLSPKKYVEEGFYIDKEKVGVAIRLQENAHPVFVSAGNRIDLKTSIAVIKQLTSTYKLPDNLRRADQASRSIAP